MSEVESLINDLRQKNIVVYGTGFVAKGVLLALTKYGLDKNICAFTGTTIDSESAYGYPLLSVEACKATGREMCYIIAVHEVHRQSIIDNLKSYGERDYVWIYPFLYEMLLGEAIERHKLVPVTQIVDGMRDCRLAVRTLAIEYVLNKNTYGKDIYIKYQMLHTNQSSAQKRFESFEGLIEDYIQTKEIKEVIKLDQYMDVLDGAHRISVANYFEQEHVLCDIYGDASLYKQWIGEGAHADLEVVQKSDLFSEFEKNIIKGMCINAFS